MLRVLVMFYNILVREKYFPLRWMKILKVCIEKGKEPILGKLRVLQLIEEDLQIMMRIYLP